MVPVHSSSSPSSGIYGATSLVALLLFVSLLYLTTALVQVLSLVRSLLLAP